MDYHEQGLAQDQSGACSLCADFDRATSMNLRRVCAPHGVYLDARAAPVDQARTAALTALTTLVVEAVTDDALRAGGSFVEPAAAALDAWEEAIRAAHSSGPAHGQSQARWPRIVERGTYDGYDAFPRRIAYLLRARPDVLSLRGIEGWARAASQRTGRRHDCALYDECA